jgi:hypothetical protein
MRFVQIEYAVDLSLHRLKTQHVVLPKEKPHNRHPEGAILDIVNVHARKVDMLTLTRTVEVKIPVGEVDDAINLRIDVFRLNAEAASNTHQFRVFRYETFRLQPLTEALKEEKNRFYSDCDLMVIDPLFDSLEIHANTDAEAVDWIISHINQRLGR